MTAPTSVRVPLDRVDNPDGKEMNTGADYFDVPVIIDPNLTLRGECRNGYGGPVIALREWNEQVFLHELLHVALLRTQHTSEDDPHGHNIISRIEVALWETGWRWVERP